MQTRQLIKKTELGLGWTVSEWDDGSMTFRDELSDQFLDLPKESVDRLSDIIAEVSAKREKVAA